MNPTPTSVSVIVLAYKNGSTLESAVRSILNQDSHCEVEVIVVASGVEKSGDLSSRLPGVRVIESEPRLYPGAARNRGLAVASGDVIAFLAADCVAEPGWLQARMRAHCSGHSAVASAVTNFGSRGPSGWGHYYSLFPNRLPSRDPGTVSIPDAAVHSTSFTRDVLLDSGPFAEDVITGEDTDMIERITSRGIEVWFEPTARTGHRALHGTLAVLQDQWRRGRLRAKTGNQTSYATWLRTLRQGFRRARFVLGRAWFYGRGERLRIVVTTPWTVVCAVVNQLGWGYQNRIHFLEHRAAVGSLLPRPEEK